MVTLEPSSSSSLPASAPPSSSSRLTSSTATAAAAAAGTLEERLSSLLSSPQFSVASYLNLALQQQQQNNTNDDTTTTIQKNNDDDDDSNNNTTTLQRRMAELALQLQLQTQSCHDDIGRIGAELQAILPRCAADVGRVGNGLEGMKRDAASLLEATTRLNNNNNNNNNNQQQQEEVSSSLETLSTLHALRFHLTKTREILGAAATWDATLSSIAPLLAQQQNLTQAVAALAQLEAGERALRGMPSGQRERQESLAKIKTQIQGLLAPQLKHALQNMHTRLAPLQQCVSLYRALHTMETLQEEYVKNRPTSIHKAWFAYHPTTYYDITTTTKQEGDEQDEKTPSFVAFLPNWYDAVLSLLAEERRQSLAVFGPDLAPEMIAKVLYECFRPILPSFQSRLESLYSARDSGSLPSICVVYEATLEFLSLAYESVAGGWLDVAEATSTSSRSLYEDVTAVFLQVASPFATYQERLSSLEQTHSGMARQSIAKDIQQAARAATPALATLQDATDRLQALAPSIFPLAEGAIGRFELLNGGFRSAQALATVDQLVSGHAGELTIAVRTLSATMTGRLTAETFDEQHAHCALQVLKVAGAFRRDLGRFQEKSRERLSVLTERMAAFAAQQKELQEAASAAGNHGGSSSSSTSFLLPDSLSVVEIDSLLTKSIFSEAEDEASLSVLQRLASKEHPVDLYPDSEESTARLASSCHSFVFDVCSMVPRQHLADMPSMSAWTESSKAGGAESSWESYGTLPQPYITHVGEHMLALVQALEPFASDMEALALANQVMDGVRSVAVEPWHEFVSAAGAIDQQGVVETLMNGKEISELVLAGGVMEEEDLEEEDAEEEEEKDESDKASAAFCNAWLDVVGLAVTGRLLERILRIPKLTPKGCEHLAADLNYLINVLTALGVSGHPHPLVNHFAELVVLDEASLREHILSRKGQTLAVLMAALRAMEVRIALMRGISVQ